MTAADGDVDQAVTDPAPGELTCTACGAGFEHSGRGRPPKRCPECRRTRASSRTEPSSMDEAPKRARGIETLRNNVRTQLTMLGMSVALFDAFDSKVIVSRAQAGADALANLAATNPRIRKALESSIEAAGWGPVLMWGAQVVLPIAAHHGLIRGVRDPAQPDPGAGHGAV